MIGYVDRKLITWLVKILLNGIDYTDIGLMQKVMIDIIRIRSRLLESPGYIHACRLHRKLEHILAFHLKRDIGLVLDYIRCRLEQPVLPELVCRARCRKFYALYVLAGAEYRCTRTIPEKHAGPSVGPVRHPCRLLGADDQHIPHLAGPVE